MKRRIILQDTPYHVQDKELFESDFLYGEVSALEYMIKGGRLNVSACGTAVSAFLGAKKNSIKRQEILYSAGLCIRTILYCIDIKNIRYGEFGLFKKEIEDVTAYFDDMNFIFYLPTYFIDDTEFDAAVDVLAKTNSSVMVSMKEKIRIDGELEPILKKTVQRFPGERVACCFRSKQEGIHAIPVLEAYKIGIVAYYA